MTSKSKLAEVGFYFDADVLGLAKVVAALRSDATFPGDVGAVIHRRRRPACPVSSRDSPDTEWIPVIVRAGWLIITRDSRIQHRRAEIAAVRDAGAKMIALGGADAGGTWAQLEVIFTQWRAIEKLAGDEGPFIYTALRSGLRPVSLE